MFTSVDLKHENKEPVIVDKKTLEMLSKKFKGLDFTLFNIDRKLSDTLKDMRQSIEVLKTDFKELQQTCIAEDVIILSREHIRNGIKTGTYGKNFTKNAEIILMSTTLNYGRFLVKEKNR